MNEWLALAIALGIGAGSALVNGLVTTIFRIPSFIATLGMFFVLQGLNNLLISGPSAHHVRPEPRRWRCSARRIGTTPFYMPLVWMFVIAIDLLVRDYPPALRQLDLCDRRQGRSGQGHGRADGAGEAHQLRRQLVSRRSRRLHAVRLPRASRRPRAQATSCSRSPPRCSAARRCSAAPAPSGAASSVRSCSPRSRSAWS